MILFYDNDFSTCAQKVRMLLNERQARWQTEWLDLRRGDQFDPNYLRLNPNGVVPTIVDGSTVVIESTLILEYLDETLPGGMVFTPANPVARFKSRLWMHRLDSKLHLQIAVLSIGIVFRHELARKTPNELQSHLAAIPNAVSREIWRGAVDKGVQDPRFIDAMTDWDKMLGDMEAALATSPWLAGDACSLADLSLLPYIVRLYHLGLLAPLSSERPNINRWFDQLRARPSYDAAFIAVISPKKIAFARECATREAQAINDVLVRFRRMPEP